MGETDDILTVLREHALVEPLRPYRDNPVFVGSEGCYLIDRQGRRYLDCTSGGGVMNAGYRNPMILNAVVDQLWHLEHAGPGQLVEPEAHLLGLLPEIVPAGLTRGGLCATEEEAVSLALELAARHSQRHEFLLLAAWPNARWPSRMGDQSSGRAPPYGIHTCGTPASDESREAKGTPAYPAEEDIVQAVNAVGLERMAAIIARPVDIDAGVVIPSEGYWPQIQALGRRLGLPLIFDETRTGVNRTGRWFAADHWRVAPDMLIVGGALSNGARLAAVMVSEPVAATFRSVDRPCGSVGPVASASALATIRFHRTAALAGRAERHGGLLLTALREVVSAGRYLAAPRGLGLMAAVDVVDETGRPDAERCERYFEQLKDWGFLLGRAGPHQHTLTIMPPLTLTDEQATLIASVLDEVQRQRTP